MICVDRKRCGLLYLKRIIRKGRRESHIPPTPLANTANIMHEAQLGTCSVRTKYTSSVNKFVYALQVFFLKKAVGRVFLTKVCALYHISRMNCLHLFCECLVWRCCLLGNSTLLKHPFCLPVICLFVFKIAKAI